MNFSTTTEYAIRTLVFMASNETRLFTSTDIFNELNIPFRYLRRQLTQLSKSGLIRSIKGKNGGYILAKRSVDITLFDIVKSVDEKQLENKCFFGFGDCALVEKCMMHDKWQAIQENILNVLKKTNLQELKILRKTIQNKQTFNTH